MSDRVTVQIEGGVADVRLNRPDKLNALDPAMFAALIETGERLKSERGLRAVVLSGEGRGFCAGLDFSSFQAMASGGEPGGGGVSLGERPAGRPTNNGQQAAFVWHELPVPTIAAVHGPALGGGLQVALACDLRIVAPDAQLSVLEVRWGLTPDMTGTQFLARLMPPDRAKELTWTGRMVSGEEAVALGLATRVAPDPRAAALELAQELAAKSPHAVRGAKQLIDLGASGASFEEGFAAEAATIGALIGSPNQVEAVTAFFEKRAGTFADPD